MPEMLVSDVDFPFCVACAFRHRDGWEGCKRGSETDVSGTPDAPSLFDAPLRDPEIARPAPAHRDARETEVEAAMTVPNAGTWRARVLNVIAGSGRNGATDWELHELLGGNLYTIAPRRVELLRDGWIEDSGLRRTTNNDRRATVWRLSARGRSQIERGSE